MPRISAQDRTVALFVDVEQVWQQLLANADWLDPQTGVPEAKIRSDLRRVKTKIGKLAVTATLREQALTRIEELKRQARDRMLAEHKRLGRSATEEALIAAAQGKRSKAAACKQVAKAMNEAEGSLGAFLQKAVLDVLDTEGMTSAMVAKALKEQSVSVEVKVATKMLTALVKEGKVAVDGAGRGKLYRRSEEGS